MFSDDNLFKPNDGSGHGESIKNSLAFQQVAPGSRRRRDFVRAYQNWVQSTANP